MSHDKIALTILFLLAFFAATLTSAPTQAAGPEPIYYWDLTELNRLDLNAPDQARRVWDTLHAVASVQGVVNRDAPRLVIRFMTHPDDFWWEHLRKDGEWLAGRPVVKIESLQQLLKTFQKQLRGVVVSTEQLAATSNLASTIAGVEDRVCLRYDPSPDSVYSKVLAMPLDFVKNVRALHGENGAPLFPGKKGEPIPDTGTPGIPSTGSAKCDAYLWLKHHYMDTGKTSPRDMAFYIDLYWLKKPTGGGPLSNCTLTNHDFFISKKAFFFDLHVWEEESPVDDPGQAPGTDVRTLRALLAGQVKRSGQAKRSSVTKRDSGTANPSGATLKRSGGEVLHIGGFTPWTWKYTNHPGAGSKHGGVDSEWKYAQIISEYTGVMDADALGLSGMANASFYQHHPLKKRYPQHARPTIESLKERGLVDADGKVKPLSFITFYMGDYDSSAWLASNVPKWWNDPARGTIPCGWAFNPNLDRRAPHVMHYARTRATPNDWFISGDCGAGYLNPGMLHAANREHGTGDGWAAWTEHNKRYFEKYDLSITGFVIDGHSPGMGEKGLDAYMEFSPDGVVGQKIPHCALHKGKMPVIRMRLDLYGSPEAAGNQLAGLVGKDLPEFMVIRTILKSPSWHKGVMKRTTEKRPEVRFVDPYTFFELMKQRLVARPRASGDGRGRP